MGSGSSGRCFTLSGPAVKSLRSIATSWRAHPVRRISFRDRSSIVRNMTTTCEALSPQSQEGRQPGMSYRVARRVLDLTVASIALALLSPVLAVVSVAIRVIMGGPVLFRQLRLGWKDRPFFIV